MNQISVSRMNLNHPEARGAGSTRGVRERGDDLLDAFARERGRQRIRISERHTARGHDLRPAPCLFGNHSVAFPRPVRAGFASGVRQLHAGHTALFMNESDDSGQRLDVILAPDTKVLRD